MALVSGEEKGNSGVGRGINVLKAKSISKDQLSTYRIFNMDELDVESMRENGTNVDVYTENSVVELAKSISVSACAEGRYMMFSASLSVDFQASTSSTEEKAYTKLVTKVKKVRYYFPDDTYRKHLYEPFAAELNSDMAPGDLFYKYGTHFLRETGVGGSLELSLMTKKNKNESKQSLKTDFKASYGAVANGSASVEAQKTAKSLLEKSTYTYKAEGGKNLTSLSIDNFFKEYPDWINSFADEPDSREFCYLPSENSLIPIWDLASTAERREQLKEEYERQAERIQSSLAKIEAFVTEIRIASDPDQANVRVAQRGFRLVDQDLNQNAKGNWIYLSYKTMTKGELEEANARPVTNLMLVWSNDAQNWSSKVLKDGSGTSATYYRINKDLNKNARGKYIYLCYTYDDVYKPLVAIDAYTDGNRPKSNEWDIVTWNGTNEIADVNKGAGGKWIYILQKHQ